MQTSTELNFNVSASELYKFAMESGVRMEYGIFWALRLAAETEVNGRYDMDGYANFTKWINSKQADFILPKLGNYKRLSGGGQVLQQWVKGNQIEVKFTGGLNGNVRMSIEWLNTDKQKEFQDWKDRKSEMDKQNALNEFDLAEYQRCIEIYRKTKNSVQATAKGIVDSGEVHTDKDLAMIIWDSRFDSQKERDEENSFTFDNYVKWVSEVNK